MAKTVFPSIGFFTNGFLCRVAGILLLLLACIAWGRVQAQVTEAMLRQHVAVLAHDSLEGRLTGTPGAEKAAFYLAGQMREMGLTPFYEGDEGYFFHWDTVIQQKQWKGTNVVGGIAGTGAGMDTIILISAHYDHVGLFNQRAALPFGSYNKRIKKDNIFNGANDNASGVAAMLELARYFLQHRPRYTVVFAAFSGEEFGMVGSSLWVNTLALNRFKLNINLEMLGRPNGMKPYVVAPEGDSRFLDLLNHSLNAGDKAKQRNAYFVADPYPEQQLFKRSDHFPFYLRGVNAYTIMASSPLDYYYHTTADDAGTLQYEAFTEIVNIILEAIKPILMEPAVYK